MASSAAASTNTAADGPQNRNSSPQPLPTAADILNITSIAKPSAAMTALVALPVVREPGWRAGMTTINIGRNVNRESALAQITGVANTGTAACDHCQKSYGPFDGCVTSPGRFSGSCGNCHWNSSGARCSFRAPNHVNDDNDNDSSGGCRHAKRRRVGQLGNHAVTTADDDDTLAAPGDERAMALHKALMSTAVTLNTAATAATATAKALKAQGEMLAAQADALDSLQRAVVDAADLFAEEAGFAAIDDEEEEEEELEEGA